MPPKRNKQWKRELKWERQWEWNHDSGSGDRRMLHTARGCTCKEFLNCQPLIFKGTEGAVKYATCTLLGGALTWWNSHVTNLGHDAAHGMPWKNLMKMMTKAYCPRIEIMKLENELWNLTVKESDKVERYVGGLPDSIQGNVMSARPKMLQEEIKLANNLMDQKRYNVARAYTAGPSEKKEYVGTLPLSPTAVADQRTLTCFECGKQGHYRSKCSKLKNRNRVNQVGSGEARGRVYALGGGEADQDPNNIADDTDV
ncbi:reverse transcriptase domain-containing protein [Tanacetum coccineum]